MSSDDWTDSMPGNISGFLVEGETRNHVSQPIWEVLSISVGNNLNIDIGQEPCEDLGIIEPEERMNSNAPDIHGNMYKMKLKTTRDVFRPELDILFKPVTSDVSKEDINELQQQIDYDKGFNTSPQSLFLDRSRNVMNSGTNSLVPSNCDLYNSSSLMKEDLEICLDNPVIGDEFFSLKSSLRLMNAPSARYADPKNWILQPVLLRPSTLQTRPDRCYKERERRVVLSIELERLRKLLPKPSPTRRMSMNDTLILARDYCLHLQESLEVAEKDRQDLLHHRLELMIKLQFTQL